LLLEQRCRFGIMGRAMELRHLRYFVAVAEAMNFTKAAAQLRVAQPALSRQVQALEDEIGVDLLLRSPRGVTLTAEGKLFLEEARQLVALAEQSVHRVRALARGEFGELHVGYAPTPTVELVPPAVAAFKTVAPDVKLVLHDLGSTEIAAGLRDGWLDLGIMLRPAEETAVGLECRFLKRYPLYAMIPARHPFARLKQVPVRRLADEPLVSLRRKEYSDYHRLLLRLFDCMNCQPRIVTECDSGSSMIAEVQAGRGIAIQPAVYRHVIGTRLKLRRLAPSNLPGMEIVVSHARKSGLTPAAEKLSNLIHRVAAKPLRQG
jgi:DNA-binding transcriptional LysR family regulator